MRYISLDAISVFPYPDHQKMIWIDYDFSQAVAFLDLFEFVESSTI